MITKYRKKKAGTKYAPLWQIKRSGEVVFESRMEWMADDWMYYRRLIEKNCPNLESCA